MQLPFRHIAQNLNLAVGTLSKMWKKFVNTGDVTPRNNYVDRRYLSERDELIVLGILYDDCTSYLSEICQHVLMFLLVPLQYRIIHRNGLTRKTMQQVALQHSSCAYMSQVLVFQPEMFMWVDETGCDWREQVQRFWVCIAMTLSCLSLFSREACIWNLRRGKYVSAICALNNGWCTLCRAYNGNC